jgi:hypothetical protein
MGDSAHRDVGMSYRTEVGGWLPAGEPRQQHTSPRRGCWGSCHRRPVGTTTAAAAAALLLLLLSSAMASSSAGPAVEAQQLRPRGRRLQVEAQTWACCGGLGGPGNADAQGAACPSDQICYRFDQWYWQCIPTWDEKAKAAGQRQLNLEQGGPRRQQQEGAWQPAPAPPPPPPPPPPPVPYWQLCGGKNGPGGQDKAAANCEKGSKCKRLDEWNWTCQKPPPPLVPVIVKLWFVGEFLWHCTDPIAASRLSLSRDENQPAPHTHCLFQPTNPNRHAGGRLYEVLQNRRAGRRLPRRRP